MNNLLQLVFWICTFSSSAVIVIRVRRYLIYWRKSPRGFPAIATLDRSPLRSWTHTLLTFWAAPTRNFHRHHRLGWTCGYLCYHVAIVTLVLSYIASGVLYAMQGGVWDVATFLRFVIGYAEPMHANFLFGSWSPWIIGFTWGDVLLAATGNILLWWNGKLGPQKVLVRSLITIIIWSEILGRLGYVPGMLEVHILAACALAFLLPWLYINHVIFLPFVLLSGLRKRRYRVYA